MSTLLADGINYTRDALREVYLTRRSRFPGGTPVPSFGMVDGSWSLVDWRGDAWQLTNEPEPVLSLRGPGRESPYSIRWNSPAAAAAGPFVVLARHRTRL